MIFAFERTFGLCPCIWVSLSSLSLKLHRSYYDDHFLKCDGFFFIKKIQVTVGASFLSQTIALQDSTTVKFEIWDTAGQERYFCRTCIDT